jgi:hypothetical protein
MSRLSVASQGYEPLLSPEEARLSKDVNLSRAAKLAACLLPSNDPPLILSRIGEAFVVLSRSGGSMVMTCDDLNLWETSADERLKAHARLTQTISREKDTGNTSCVESILGNSGAAALSDAIALKGDRILSAEDISQPGEPMELAKVQLASGRIAIALQFKTEDLFCHIEPPLTPRQKELYVEFAKAARNCDRLEHVGLPEAYHPHDELIKYAPRSTRAELEARAADESASRSARATAKLHLSRMYFFQLDSTPRNTDLALLLLDEACHAGNTTALTQRAMGYYYHLLIRSGLTTESEVFTMQMLHEGAFLEVMRLVKAAAALGHYSLFGMELFDMRIRQALEEWSRAGVTCTQATNDIVDKAIQVGRMYRAFIGKTSLPNLVRRVSSASASAVVSVEPGAVGQRCATCGKSGLPRTDFGTTSTTGGQAKLPRMHKPAAGR